ncbi:MAG: hypothetical protein B6I36_06960 [Desulfobacteraceae bacterium 4572_35.1]|nr:MAG: hypothetical protein B6I36_06960 [Desulfobacteraceae bacterium 4572_35.1]
MIDYHCHILPGLDDGSRDVAESIEMATLLVDAGFSCVHCTPHCISNVYDISVEQVRGAVTELQHVLINAGIPLQLKPGMEYYVDDQFFERLDNLQTLGDSNLLLFEISPTGNFNMLRRAVFQLRQRGLIPLLAHPERYPNLMSARRSVGFLRRFMQHKPQIDSGYFGKFPSVVEEIISAGCFFQGNIGSFSGVYGQDVLCTAKTHRDQGHYQYFGSDGHRPGHLKRSLRGLELLHVGIDKVIT